MSDDLIRRSDVLGYLSRLNGCGLGKVKSLEYIRKYVERLPSADRPQGEWIPSDTDGFVCSVCKNGYRNQPTLMGRPMFEYCPVCGAKMKGADDEND